MKIFQIVVIFLNFLNVNSLINNFHCDSHNFNKLTNKIKHNKLLILKEKNQLEEIQSSNNHDNEYIINVGSTLDILHRELPLVFVLKNPNFNIFSNKISIVNGNTSIINVSKPIYIASIKSLKLAYSILSIQPEINVRKIEYIEDTKNIQCFVEIITSSLVTKQKWKGMFYFGIDNKGLINSHTFDRKINVKKTPRLISKCNSFLKIIRAQSIIPTLLLCFSGGWIINPSIINLLYSKSFIVSTINTILIMSSSMVLNDIYDLEIDKLNSPNRPLVNGEIKISEAFLVAALLLGIVEYLTLNYLTATAQLIIQFVIIKINLYTPILKRIIVLKNISCASLVAFSLFFSGLSVTNTIMINNKNFNLLLVAMSMIFFGSWSNEIILDMRDIFGDRKNNIATIPTTFGNKFAWIFTNILLGFGIISNTLTLSYLYNNLKLGFIEMIILSPLLINLHNIKKETYSEQSIINYMKYSNVCLVVLLFYFCLLAKIY